MRFLRIAGFCAQAASPLWGGRKAESVKQFNRMIKCTVFHRRAFVLFLPAHAAGHLLFYLRFAGGFLTLPRQSPQAAFRSRYAARFLLAPRPFVQPTLPVRAVQAGLSTAERRGERRSRPRWLSAAASVERPKKETKSRRECDSRAGSLYPYFVLVRSREYFLNLRLFIKSGRPGAVATFGA